MRVVLFDIDATLILSQGAGRAAFAETFLGDFRVERFRGDVAAAGRSDRAIARDLFALHGIADTPATWERFHRGYVQRLEVSLATRPGRLAPGALPLLQALAGRSDVVLGLLTGNVAAGAWLKLARHGIDRFFRFGGFGDEHVDRDDIAAAALRAADRHLRSAGITAGPARTTVIGDTPADVRCARSITARAIAVATGASSLAELAATAPDLAVTDLTDDAVLAMCGGD